MRTMRPFLLLLFFLVGTVPAVRADYSLFGDAALRGVVSDPGTGDSFLSESLLVNGDHTIAFSWGEARLRHSLELVSAPASSGGAWEELVHSVYQADIAWYPADSLTIKSGRHQLGWGMGYAFFPTDTFHPERDPEGSVRGFDGASLSWIAAPDWTLTGALRIDEAVQYGGADWWSEFRYALYLNGYLGGVEAAMSGVWQAGEVPDPGAGISFQLLGSVISAEAAVDAFSAGIERSFHGERLSLVVLAEYLWDDGEHRLYPMLSIELDGAFGTDHSALIDPADGSGEYSHSIWWSNRDGLELSAEAGWGLGELYGGAWSAALQAKIYF